jgi:hypothetical protein
MVSCIILSYHDDKKEDPTLKLFKFEGPFKSERYFFLFWEWGIFNFYEVPEFA